MIIRLHSNWVREVKCQSSHQKRDKYKLLMLINPLQRIKTSHQKTSKNLLHKMEIIQLSAINKTRNKIKRNISHQLAKNKNHQKKEDNKMMMRRNSQDKNLKRKNLIMIQKK